ncbi:MAG TPA: hypothetical protein VM537_04475 [Anaerolineae bacterium]|nr:hypothetical protein [Anaerolineae bacterium]
MANTIMAQVTMDTFGKLEATVNSNLDERQQILLACQCAELFARLAAQVVLATDAEQKTPKILVPQVGFKL